ncbi:uncharacterized protein LOC106080210 isoform X1 [Biomphalaria glabrata]|uniref:Uncharacterized protein LOC106080210 isoform X1 n=1 Tax=Biomphalaria glabrata TaxID=6526 RepID=A0A9W2YMW3_BIOGL|nr:uncharacterized protein LOC106080210 isoform X1 [Biomphalaria glabrata]
MGLIHRIMFVKHLLALSLRPFYLPRDFGVIYIVLVYVPPTAKTEVAAAIIADVVHEFQTRSPDAPVVILGDFNKCTLKVDLPTFYQHISCPTRENRTLDLCYCNIKGAFTSREKPPLGSSDHKTIQLLPTYRTKLKEGKIIQKNVQEWTQDNILKLQGCLDCTDWSLFKETTSNLEEWVDAVTNYIKFCENMCVSTKSIKIYPNNKPWVTAKIKREIIKKKRAFMSGDGQTRKIAQRNLNVVLEEGRRNYRTKLEDSINTSDMRQAWGIMNKMAGAQVKFKNNLATRDEKTLANELNDFYCRFDTKDFNYLRLKALEDVNVNNCLELAITKEQVCNIFKNVNPMKAGGPDGIKGRILKECAEQLAEPFQDIFSTSLLNHEIPPVWKSSIIVPVPKVSKPKEMNDYRPVSLTSIVSKCLEKLVKMFLLNDLCNKLDPLQFAYQKGKGVDDAILNILNCVYKHLDLPNTYVRLLFMDFSSAFNTIQLHLLIEKMKALQISPYIILWANEFLTQRAQRVRVNNVVSNERIANTGAPQGAVTSPLWFILYTNDFQSDSSCCSFTKFADDAALLALLSESSDVNEYFKELEHIGEYCRDNFLLLNVKKTKEMIIDFRRDKKGNDIVSVAGETIEIVQTFKYLGTILDNKLNFTANTDYISKKGQQRLRLLRKLSSFNVSEKALAMFYHAHICNILSFNITAWYGNLSIKNKNKLYRILNAAGKIIGKKQTPFGQLFETNIYKKANKILEIKNHPLCQDFVILPSQKRYKTPIAKTNRHKHSFVPLAIKSLNKNNLV